MNETDGFNVDIGSSVTITCKIREKDTGIQQWLFNDISISYDGDLLTNHERRTITGETEGATLLSHLVIENVQVEDEGMYICKFGEYQIEARLVVLGGK